MSDDRICTWFNSSGDMELVVISTDRVVSGGRGIPVITIEGPGVPRFAVTTSVLPMLIARLTAAGMRAVEQGEELECVA